ncbi:Oidioi.mRNA.OKI2018_I69.XSR.g16862.t1.cds [Oikopleura dioica]|uniref:Oidioi.mRNA.OKI2018_I69.XSR.g16862.t1.cds n=1 Tax=Oikopleura dioica TaxID=34765 RepID=A0ABN7SHG3_OIKDI|nr:Oidioi.mRNA.OKI2018_I69.XSR.g16862.t1.cds [Oikopleura dioica]
MKFLFFLVSCFLAQFEDQNRDACNEIDCNYFQDPFSWPSCFVRGDVAVDLSLHPCRLLLADCKKEPFYAGKCRKEEYGDQIIISVESEYGLCEPSYCSRIGVCFYEYFDTSVWKCICPTGYHGEHCQHKYVARYRNG